MSKNIFNVSDEEKNRIRGLHLTESSNKKISSVLSEQLKRNPWFNEDCMEWEVQPGNQYGGSQRGFWTGEGREIAVCTVGENKGKNIDSRLCGDSGQFITAVYLGISCEECCSGISNDDSDGDIGIVDVELDYDFNHERYTDCYGEIYIKDFNNKLGTRGPLDKDLMYPGKDYMFYCMKEPYVGIPITNMTYTWQGELRGIPIEVCCGERSLDDGVGEDMIDIDIEDDTIKKRKGCRWRPEPKDKPTLGPNGYSINNHKICHEGDKVKLIQGVLLEEGYDLGRSGINGDGVDGKFGKKTKKAVQEYQRKYDLPISCDPNCDGVVGDETWKQMFDEEVAGEAPIIEPDVTIDIENEIEGPMTDEELENFIEDNLEDKTKRKECRKTIRLISKKIKDNPYSQEVLDMIDNAELKTTLGYCFDERNYPVIMKHARRVKKAFGLKGKGNI